MAEIVDGEIKKNTSRNRPQCSDFIVSPHTGRAAIIVFGVRTTCPGGGGERVEGPSEYKTSPKEK